MNLLDMICAVLKTDKHHEYTSNLMKSEIKGNKTLESIFDFPFYKYSNLCLCIPTTCAPNFVVYNSKDFLTQVKSNYERYLKRASIIDLKKNSVILPGIVNKFLGLNLSCNTLMTTLKK